MPYTSRAFESLLGKKLQREYLSDFTKVFLCFSMKENVTTIQMPVEVRIIQPLYNKPRKEEKYHFGNNSKADPTVENAQTC